MNLHTPSKLSAKNPPQPVDFSATKKGHGRLRLSSIKPWTWFLHDFTVAYISGLLAFVTTPHSIFANSDAIDGIHVGAQTFSFALAFLVAVVAHIAGLHEIRQRTRSFKLFGYCGLVSLAALLLINIELSLIHDLKIGRFITVSALALCTLSLFAVRGILISLMIRSDHVVAFVGSGKFTRRALECNQPDPTSGLRTCSLDLDSFPTTNIRNWAITNGVHELVVNLDDENTPSQAQLLDAIQASLTVSSYSRFNEELFERVPTEHINSQWIIDCQTDQTLLYKRGFKRILDIGGALIALLLLTPVMLIAALLIKIDSRGPILYRQSRLGLFSQPFEMLKLRTMRVDAESKGVQWATRDDPRITRVGKYLRASRLDEAPQLVNVLLGQMSLVGPRPERPEFTKDLEKRIPFFVHRLLVKPGITGWAQINSPYAAEDTQHIEKLSFDLYYIKTLSFGMDLRILLRTLSLFATGSR